MTPDDAFLFTPTLASPKEGMQRPRDEESDRPGQPGDVVEPAVLIRPGVFEPGRGQQHTRRVAIPGEFIRQAADSMEGQPVNLGHSDEVQDEVGFVANVEVDADAALRADLVLQRSRPRFSDAVAFIEARRQAGQVPEVSVEIAADGVEFREAEPDETFQGEPFDVMLLAGQFQGVALLPKGACGADDGCGVGLEGAAVMLEAPGIAFGVVPDTPDVGFVDEAWTAPTLSDFRDERGIEEAQLSEWSDDDVAWLLGHHLWADSDSPDTFDQLKFAVRQPDRPINLRALRAALAVLGGARGGADIPSDDRDRVRRRARSLLEEGDDTVEQEAQAMSESEAEECGCGAFQAANLLREKVAALEDALTDARDRITELEHERDEALERVESLESARKQALVEAVKAHADEEFVEEHLDPEAPTDVIEAQARTVLALSAPGKPKVERETRPTRDPGGPTDPGDGAAVDDVNSWRMGLGLDPVDPDDGDSSGASPLPRKLRKNNPEVA